MNYLQLILIWMIIVTIVSFFEGMEDEIDTKQPIHNYQPIVNKNKKLIIPCFVFTKEEEDARIINIFPQQYSVKEHFAPKIVNERKKEYQAWVANNRALGY